jgi:hypothetical protein
MNEDTRNTRMSDECNRLVYQMAELESTCLGVHGSTRVNRVEVEQELTETTSRSFRLVV